MKFITNLFGGKHRIRAGVFRLVQNWLIFIVNLIFGLQIGMTQA